MWDRRKAGDDAFAERDVLARDVDATCMNER